ncbi:MAG: alpha-L-fucosidase [Bacteroidetes bacterium]|nr:alpha-L-fucosidase [Bacteroidota bacterium]
MVENAPAPYGALPSEAQLNWHEMEMYCLIHFTPTTFENKEWGYGDASPSIFNPAHFDANQIAAAAKSAGFNGLVSVAKHHDGFCLYPTKATNYNISKSPWRNGKGDMVKEFMEAAHKQGMQFGVYCSAWDRNDASYGTPLYVQHYREELTELYSNYGPLFISWHDGANGGDGYYGGAKEKRTIDRSTYYDWPSIWQITRKMQPGAVIFSDIGPDVRWVGNERGTAGETCWATFSPVGPDGKSPAPGFVDDRFLTTGQRDGKYWIPAECDVPLRPGWFYHPDQDDKVKTPDQLFDLYLKSVGRGACLNLGLAPDRDGLLQNNDVLSLKAFGDKVRKSFSDNLAKNAVFHASNIRNKNDKNFGTVNLTDNDRYSYWATDDKETHPELTIDLKTRKRFNIIRLRENIKLGQRLDSVIIEQWQNNQWQRLASATSIGSTRLIRLPEFVTTQKLRIHFYAPVCIALSDVGLFAEAKADYTAINSLRHSINRAGWKIIANTPTAPGSKKEFIFDNNKNTFWETAIGILPQQITIDMGKVQPIIAFSVLPRQDKKTAGLISKYIFETSADGKNWQSSAEGEFSNIAANPVDQYVSLNKKTEARYIRLQATAVAGNDNAPKLITIAELNVY